MTERMTQVLKALALRPEPMTPNQIALSLGFAPAPSQGGIGAGRGSGAGTAPAQHVIFSLNRLRELGLVGFGRRPDGRSGTAYSITSAGRATLDD